MRQHAFRLTRGQDLKKEINNYLKQQNIQAGILLCAVGCLTKVRIRTADGVSVFETEGQYEIVSLQGTLSANGSHLHIALSDENLQTIGGHLLDGCLVNTTAEIVLLEMTDLLFEREYDKLTTYQELVIKKIKQ